MIARVIAAGVLAAFPLLLGACDDAGKEAGNQPGGTQATKAEATADSGKSTASSGSASATQVNLSPEEREKAEKAQKLYEESQKTLNRGGASEAQARLYNLPKEVAEKPGQGTSTQTSDDRQPGQDLWSKMAKQKKSE